MLYWIAFRYRSLENGYILVESRLLVPPTYVAHKVPYKYIVWKANRKGSREEGEYLWDRLVGWGVKSNRSLNIPRDYCKPEGIFRGCYTLIFGFVQSIICDHSFIATGLVYLGVRSTGITTSLVLFIVLYSFCLVIIVHEFRYGQQCSGAAMNDIRCCWLNG